MINCLKYKKIKIVLNTIFFFLLSFNVIPSQIIFDYYGFYDWDKIVDINKERRFVVFNTNGIGTSNIGVQVTGGCDGYLEYFNGYFLAKLYRRRRF